MENQFNRQLLESAERTVEAIETITWPLAVNQELKALDDQGDLCTIVNTGSEIHYIHRSNREEGQAGVVEFKVPLVVNNEETQEEVANAE